MTKEPDARLKHGESFGVTISIQDLLLRWNANIKLIDELCLSKKIIPYRDSYTGFVNTLDGNDVITFTPTLTNEFYIDCDINDCPQFQSLPNDAFFSMPDILSFEDMYPEIKKSQNNFETSNIAPADDTTTKKKKNKVELSPIFAPFENLRAYEISLIFMKDHMVKMRFRNTTIKVSLQDLGFKDDKAKDWKLFETASLTGGVLTNALTKLNKSSNLEKERNKIKGIVSRLRSKIKNKLGLESDPIIYNGEYKFTFHSMANEITDGGAFTQSLDALDYIDSKEIDYNKIHNKDFNEGNDSDYFDNGYEDNYEEDEDVENY